MASAGFFPNETPMGVRVAQAVGITASAYLFGQNVGLTLITIPTILDAPAPLAARQWKKMYNIGAAMAPPLAVVSSLALGYIAYKQNSSTLACKLNTTAAVLFPSIIPFTFAFIVPTNKKLFERARSPDSNDTEAGAASEETTHALIDYWGTLNLARQAILGAGVGAAIWAAVGV